MALSVITLWQSGRVSGEVFLEEADKFLSGRAMMLPVYKMEKVALKELVHSYS